MTSPKTDPSQLAQQFHQDLLVACVDRELAFREKSYPRWVKQGKLTESEAARQLYLMRAVRARLLIAENWRRKLAELGVTI